MSYNEPSEKDIKLINKSTQITSNDFFYRKKIIQKERIVSIEKQIQIKLRNINRLNDYHRKASKSLSDISYVQISKPVFKNSVLNKAFKSYQNKQTNTKMKHSLSHSYINTNAKQKSRNQDVKNYLKITGKRIYCINGRNLNSHIDNSNVSSHFRGGWYKDNTLKVRSLFNLKTRNAMNICHDKSFPNIEINTVH